MSESKELTFYEWYRDGKVLIELVSSGSININFRNPPWTLVDAINIIIKDTDHRIPEFLERYKKEEWYNESP